MTDPANVGSDRSDHSDHYDIVRLVRSDAATGHSDQSVRGPSGPTSLAVRRIGNSQSKQCGPSGPTGPTEWRDDGVARTPEEIEAMWNAAVARAQGYGRASQTHGTKKARHEEPGDLTAGFTRRTWTGRVVSLEEWRQMSEWDRRGPNGKVWCGKRQNWIKP